MRRCILMLIILSLLVGCSNKKSEANTSYRIAVITMMQGGEFWGALKNGARSARSSTGAVLEFLAPVNESDYEGQISAVQRAIDQQFDAIVLSPSHYTRLEDVVAKARSSGIKVVLADTALRNQSGDFLITADYRQIGKAMAELITIFRSTDQCPVRSSRIHQHDKSWVLGQAFSERQTQNHQCNVQLYQKQSLVTLRAMLY